ncbi:methylglyoxal synthase, partial [Erwinia amylovora]|uniref:methylglyoxal synthase n=1 Tax=Erwinia amylovora TaxID=552 RepID=UPI00200A1405
LHTLFAYWTTGNVVQRATGLPVTALLSCPIGGDQQLVALISVGRIDLLIFYSDPLNALQQDPEVKSILRLATELKIHDATNRATADVIIHSP